MARLSPPHPHLERPPPPTPTSQSPSSAPLTSCPPLTLPHGLAAKRPSTGAGPSEGCPSPTTGWGFPTQTLRTVIERHRLSRQRPDGLLLTLRRRRVYVCEFTRAYDSHPDYQVRADQYKFQKYHALLTRLRASLPSRWKVEFISFTAGVNGSIPKAVWLTHFNKLGIRLKHQCDSIFQKVSAALFRGHALVVAA